MSPADAIALKATEFIRECKAHGLSWTDIREVVAETNSAYEEATYDHERAQDFQSLIRRQQVINKVSTTCERLRRGTAQEVEA